LSSLLEKAKRRELQKEEPSGRDVIRGGSLRGTREEVKRSMKSALVSKVRERFKKY